MIVVTAVDILASDRIERPLAHMALRSVTVIVITITRVVPSWIEF